MINERDLKRILQNDIQISAIVEDRISSTLSGIGASPVQGTTATVPMRRVSRKLVRTLLIAAVIVILSAGAALASSGVLRDFFSAFTSNEHYHFNNPSIEAIVEHGYVTEVVLEPPVMTENNATQESTPIIESNSMVLNAYYIDRREIGLDFTLSSDDIGILYAQSAVHLETFSMEMEYGDGEVDIWEQTLRDGFASRTYPGGHFIVDRINDIQEYEPGQDFDVGAGIVMNDDGSYNLSIIIGLDNETDIGKILRISFDGLHISIVNENETAREVTIIAGGWSFEIEVDSRYIDNNALSYESAVGFSAPGIEITNVTVEPSICTVEAMIDFTASGFETPENADLEATDWGTAEENRAKMNMFDLGLQAIDSDGNIYSLRQSNYADVTDGIVTCWFRLDSMFFDAPESLTLRFTSHTGVVIDVPLVLQK